MKISEREIQKTVVQYLRLKYPKVFFTISPIVKYSNARQGAIQKAMGYTSGTPDIMIFKPNPYYYSLFIELKSEKGKISQNQKEFINYLNSNGYCAIICYSIDMATRLIDWYMNLKRESFDTTFKYI